MRALLALLVISLLSHRVLLAWARKAFPKARLSGRFGTVMWILLSIAPVLTRAVLYLSDTALFRALNEALAVEGWVAISAMIPILILMQITRSKAVPAPSAATHASSIPALDAALAAFPPAIPAALKLLDAPSRRQMVLSSAGAAVYAGSGFLSIYGNRKARFDFTIEEVVVKIPGLSPKLDGYTIAQVSDIHVGAFMNERELRYGFEQVSALKPDLVVATGDLVDFQAELAPMLATLLREIRARDGHYAIMGNHDHYAGAARVAEAVKRAGVQVLVNDARVLRAGDGGGFSLLGVDDMSAPRHQQTAQSAGPDFWAAAKQVPSDLPRILLAHQPRFIDWVKGHVALQLSGHTHGGQINPIVTPADWIMPYVKGRYQVGGSTLWVNRGFGVTGPPVRLGAPPEITKIILVSG